MVSPPEMTEAGSKASKTIIKGAALLTGGQVAIYSLSFVRNLILARILTKADFGLAAAMAMTISLLELVSRMSFGVQIIQAKNGDTPRFQAVSHAVQMMFGLGSALIVALGAYPMARIFSVPELTWAFALLSVVPLARGAMHLDVMRFKRRFNYLPSVLMEFSSQGAATIAAWPLAVWLKDFRAVLLIMLGKEALCLAISHLLAKRPYKWAWDARQVRQMLLFGWPLLLNALVMFAAQQGDQMIIGAAFSLSDLGLYSIAFTVCSIVYQIFAQVGSSLMLPGLSHLQNETKKFKEYYRLCLELSTIISLLLLGPLIVSGEAIIRLLYGTKYAGAGSLIMIFSVAVALRFFRWAPAVASMSKADTLNQLYGNIARSISLLLAFIAILSGQKDILIIAMCGILGEIAAISATLYRIRRKFKISLCAHLAPLLYLTIWIIIGVLINRFLGIEYSIWLGLAASVGLLLFGTTVSLVFFPTLRYFLNKSILKRQLYIKKSY